METEAKRQRALLQAPPTAVAAEDAAAAAVFGNVDLLREILLLLDAPPYLIRAALVSKHWLGAAADPAFLRRFRARSPPRLLGFLASFGRGTYPTLPDVAVVRFVPLPHPPEFAAAARIVGAAFNGGKPTGLVVGCRNGRVLIKIGGDCGWRYSVRSPLCSPAVATVTRPPRSKSLPGRVYNEMECGVRCVQWELLPYPGADDPRDALSGFGQRHCGDGGEEPVIHQVVYVRRQTRGWDAHVSPPLHLPVPLVFNRQPYSLLVGARWLCMTTILGCIFVFDLTTATFSVVSYPDGVSCRAEQRIHSLARAGDSGIYLVHVKALELHVWFRRMDAGDEGIWERVDTVYLPLVFGHNLSMEFWDSVDALNADASNLVDPHIRDFYRIEIHAAGDDAEFMFLRVGKHGDVFLLDVKKRTVEEVLQTSLENDGGPLCGISPFMMPWPPVFPALLNPR